MAPKYILVVDVTLLIHIYIYIHTHSISRKLATTGKNVENGLCSLNVISVFTTMIGSQIQTRYPLSTHTDYGVRGDGVTCVDDARKSL